MSWDWLHILFMFELYAILVVAANLVTGYSGLLSFANAVFYGLGAYCTAILMTSYSISFPIAFLISLIVAGSAGAFLAILTKKLSGLYFVIATIAFQVILFNVFYNWEKLTGGSLGISGIPNASIFGLELKSTLSYAILGGLILFVLLSIFIISKNSPFIRVLEAMRDNELGAITLGKNVAGLKFTTIILSSAIMAMSGTLFATYNHYIDATSFTLDESILIVSMLLIGGTGNIKGPLIGALFFVLLPEFIREIPIADTKGASLQMMIYGLILILIVRFKPNGFFGTYNLK